MVAIAIPTLNAYAGCENARSVATDRLNHKIRLCWEVRNDGATRIVLRSLLAKAQALRVMV